MFDRKNHSFVVGRGRNYTGNDAKKKNASRRRHNLFLPAEENGKPQGNRIKTDGRKRSIAIAIKNTNALRRGITRFDVSVRT